MPLAGDLFYHKPPMGSRPAHGRAQGVGIRAAWLFNEYAGARVYDPSGYNNTGPFSAAPADPSWAPGRYAGERSLYFDGNDDIQPPDSWSLKNFADGLSVVSWIQHAAWADAGIVAKGAAGADWKLWIGADTRVHWDVGVTGSQSGLAPIAANTWYQVVGTYDGAVQRLYINGAEVDADANVAGVAATATPVLIGTEGANWLTGYIDHVIIYGRCLHWGEVAELWAAPFAGMTTPRFDLPWLSVNMRPPGQCDIDWTMVRGKVRSG